MTEIFRRTFEGGTNGASANGEYASSSGTWTYSAANAIHGGLAATSTAGASAILRHDYTARTAVYEQFYVRAHGTPSAFGTVWRVRNAASSTTCEIRVDAGGVIQVRNGFTAVDGSANTIPLDGSPVRVMIRVDGSGAAGTHTVDCRIFYGANLENSDIDGYDARAFNTGLTLATADFTHTQLGPASSGVFGVAWTVDTHTMDDAAWPPPENPPATDTTAPTVTVAEVHGSGAHVDIYDSAGYDSTADILTVSGTAADTGGSGLSTVEVRVDGGAWVAATGTSSWSHAVDVSAWAAGTHTIDVRATDAAANVSAVTTVTVWHSPDGVYGWTASGHAPPLIVEGTDEVPASNYSAAQYGIAVAGGSFNDGAVTAAAPGTYGADWFYDVDAANRTNEAGLAFLRARGHDLIRVDFRWERLQPTLNAALNAAEIGRITAMLNAANNQGLKVLLDCHNYGHYKPNSSAPNATSAQGGYSLGEPELPYSAFADLWTRIVTQWGAHPAVWGWELMNEPVSMASTTSAGDTTTGAQHWRAASQEAVNAIRTAETTTKAILVGGYDWSHVYTWAATNGNPWITDPAADINKLIYTAHHYWDSGGDSSYGTDSPTSIDGSVQATSDRITAELANFTNWLTTHGVRGAVTEFGWPDNAAVANWNTVASNWLAAAAAANLHLTVWATGAAWGNYELSTYEATGFNWGTGDVIDVANLQAPPWETAMA